MSTVHVVNDYGKCGYQNGRLIVEVSEKERRFHLRRFRACSHREHPIIRAVDEGVLEEGSDCHFPVEVRRILYGKLHSTKHQHIERQRKQFMLEQDDFSLALSKRLVEGKLNNQQVLLRRIFRDADCLKNLSSDLIHDMGDLPE